MKSIPLAPKQPARHGGRLVSTVGVVGAWVITGWVVDVWVTTTWVVGASVMTGWVVDVWASLPPHAPSTTSTQAKIAAGDFIVMVCRSISQLNITEAGGVIGKCRRGNSCRCCCCRRDSCCRWNSCRRSCGLASVNGFDQGIRVDCSATVGVIFEV